MKQVIISIILSLLFIGIINAQEDKKENKFGIEFHGFVKNDVIFDSRQTVTAREGHFLLYPTNEAMDIDGKDINATPNFNMLSIQSRLSGKITCPDAFGAKTSGLLEGAFFGHSNADINGFRLRHALVKLSWTKAELVFGQTWHPMFVTDCFAGTVSFNTGVPFQPFSRNPQVNFSYKLTDKLKVSLYALAERDFASTGPNGLSSQYKRNSAMPDGHLRLQYNSSNKDKNTAIASGIGVGFKQLAPRTVTDSNIYNKETVNSLSVIGYTKYVLPKITIKLEAVLGQNMYDLLMIGGYAVDFIADTAVTNYDYREYTTLDVASFWTDIHTNGKKFQFGVFAGYSQNLGSTQNIMNWNTSPMVYARGYNIAYLYRVSPRIVFNSGKVRIAGELEYTVAAYGDSNNSLGEVQNTKEVANIRALLGVFYFF